ncbi:uncharacterized protein LOC110811112 [Carica papaya]|uniref:uncharacterized protein LOC110811112 n=1 Tax=Carica papaya TaxID=3649 RepID=UPI000B8C9D52|nr:uncharacterized protein LOC110811112 [Carica papaya]
MMVANSFDLWQKDAFFSAAEEVQESADIMESAYRLWIREKGEGRAQEDLDELFRELQAALGTAKWQLEEFERAVRLSRGHRFDEITATRHRQFVAAIENQISRVEAALRETFSEEGKQPLRWVNLDEEECNDLAIFLSGTSQTSMSVRDDCIKSRPVKTSLVENRHRRNGADLNANSSCSTDTSDEKKSLEDVRRKDADCVIEVEEKVTPRRDDLKCQPDRATWSSPNFSALRIAVADEDEERNKLMTGVEATPKEKRSKPFFWMQRSQEHYQVKRAVNLFNQLFGRVGRIQRPFQSPQMQFSCSVQLTLALMLTIFLIVPFVLFST